MSVSVAAHVVAAPAMTPAMIYRQVSFTLPVFDHLKAWQRHWERTEGRRLTNSQVVARLILATTIPTDARPKVGR